MHSEFSRHLQGLVEAEIETEAERYILWCRCRNDSSAWLIASGVAVAAAMTAALSAVALVFVLL